MRPYAYMSNGSVHAAMHDRLEIRHTEDYHIGMLYYPLLTRILHIPSDAVELILPTCLAIASIILLQAFSCYEAPIISLLSSLLIYSNYR